MEEIIEVNLLKFQVDTVGRKAKHTVKIHPEETIVDLKIAIGKELNLAYSQQVLIYQSTILDELRDIQSYDIRDGDWIIIATPDNCHRAVDRDAVPQLQNFKRQKSRGQLDLNLKLKNVSKGRRLYIRVINGLRFIFKVLRVLKGKKKSYCFRFLEPFDLVIEPTMPQLVSVMTTNPHRRSFNAIKRLVEWMRELPWASTCRLPPAVLANVARNMQYERLNSGDYICQQGDEGDKFYIILTGEICVCIRHIGRVAVLRPGDHFGEMSLLVSDNAAQKKRTASCIVNYTENSSHWYAEVAVIDKETYLRSVFRVQHLRLDEKTNYLNLYPEFESLSQAGFARLSYLCGFDNLPAASCFIENQSSLEPSKYYLLVKGMVKVRIDFESGKSLVYMAKGPTQFGEYCGLSGLPETFRLTVTSISPATILTIPFKEFKNMIRTVNGFLHAIQDIYDNKMKMYGKRLAETESAVVDYSILMTNYLQHTEIRRDHYLDELKPVAATAPASNRTYQWRRHRFKKLDRRNSRDMNTNVELVHQLNPAVLPFAPGLIRPEIVNSILPQLKSAKKK